MTFIGRILLWVMCVNIYCLDPQDKHVSGVVCPFTSCMSQDSFGIKVSGYWLDDSISIPSRFRIFIVTASVYRPPSLLPSGCRRIPRSIATRV